MNQPEIQEMMETINSNLLLLKNKSVYELTQKKGNPKCSVLSARIDKNIKNVVGMYEEIIKEEEEAADQERFDTLRGMLAKITKEFEVLAKKQPDKLLNPFKIKQVNRILAPLRELMKDEMAGPFLELVEEAETGKAESRNSYSDVSVILCQYEEACCEYRIKYYEKDSFHGM